MTYIAMPLGYVLRIIYAKKLPLEEFGLIYAIIGLFFLISIFNDLGFTETIKYYATKFYEKKNYSDFKGTFYFALIMQAGTALIISAIFYVISPWLATSYFKSDIALKTLRLFIPYFILYNIVSPFSNIIIATHTYYSVRLTELIKSAGLIIFSLPLIFMTNFQNSNYIALTWGAIYFLILIIFLLKTNKKFREFKKVKINLSFKLFKKLLKYSKYVVLSSGAFFLLSRMDIFFLTKFTNLADVGIYSVCLSIGAISTLMIGPLTDILFPLTTKLYTNKDKTKINLIIKKVYELGLYFFIPLLLIIITYSRELLLVMFGEEFVRGAVVLIILSASYFVTSLSTLNLNINSGMGRIKEKNKIIYTAAIINIALDLILIPKYGMIGAAVATLIGTIVMFIGSYLSITTVLKTKLNTRNLIKTLLLSLFLVLVIYGLKKAINLNMYLEAIIIGVIGITLYLLLGKILKLYKIRAIIDLFKRNFNTK